MRQDIFRRLTFGIKKTTRRIDRSKEDESSTASLRLRVLPENIKEELRALRRAKNDHHNQKEDIRDERQEENRGVKLFSDGSAVGSAKSSRYKDASDSNKVSICNDEIREQITEKVYQLRRLNRIYTWGEDIPEPFIDFEDLNLPSVLLSSLKEFGVTEPTPIQMQAIPLLTVHRDILASAPTGSGKTLAFAIPLILDVLRLKKLAKYKDGSKLLAIVLEPTRELAAQTYRQFLKYGQHLPVRPALFENEDIPKNVDILVSTPNRLTHHLQDVILKYLRCKENLSNVAVVCIGERNSANANVTQELVFAGSEYGKLVAIRTLLQTQFEPPALIFVQSKERARELLTALSSLTPPIPVSFISSEKSQSEREAVVESFRLGQVWVLICTELMGRGLDLRNVNLVINYDLPTSIVSYIHRIGRTGRAGRHGRAVTYFTESDTKYLRPIATVIHQAGFEVPEYTLTLKPLSRPNEKKQLLRHAPKRKHIAFVKKEKKKRSVVRSDRKQSEEPNVAKMKHKHDFMGTKIAEKFHKVRKEGNTQDVQEKKRKKLSQNVGILLLCSRLRVLSSIRSHIRTQHFFAICETYVVHGFPHSKRKST
ncbi:hypothetical protein Angca_006652 [Angiostrongylus cantonensis]|nr:hypothetical protein Angca_006652 [Angiostrongylus cantonensis]